MKVIYVTSESFKDHSYTIVKHLQKVINLQVFILSKEKTEEIEEFCRKLKATFLKRPRYRNPYALIFDFKFILRLKRLKPDIVWFNNISFFRSLFVKLFLHNYLINIHDLDLHPAEKDYQGIVSQWVTVKLHKLQICTVSKTQGGIFKNQYGIPPRVFQLPIIDYYGDMYNEKLISSTEQNDVVRFFFFSTIEKYKGIETLLEAVEILEIQKYMFKMNIYGKLIYNETSLLRKINSLKSKFN